MRKAKPKKRLVLPDPVFNDQKVSKFVNHLMYDGKKTISYEIFYNALDIVKGKMAKEGVQLVSVTNHFKFEAPDGKQRAADALDADCVKTLAKHYPNNRANAFLDWFLYSDNTIDGQSKKKAYTLVESGLLETLKPGTVKALQQIHAYLFGGLYDFAGKIRTKTISVNDI